MSGKDSEILTHIENLKPLCRVCGGKLKRKKDIKYDGSYLCTEYKDFLAKHFNLNIDKDAAEIHPPRFCNLCYVSASDRTHLARQTIFWEIHVDQTCKVCSAVLQMKKGGRPKKAQKGRKPSQKTEKASTSAQSQAPELEPCERLKEIITSISPEERNRPYNSDQFTVIQNDLQCSICKDALHVPVKTSCQHYYCATCLQTAMNTGITGCPLCKAKITNIEKPDDKMVLRLIADLKLQCRRCLIVINYNEVVSHICTAAQPVVALPGPSTRSDSPTLTQAMEDLKQGKITPEVETLGLMFVKSKFKDSMDGKSALLKTRGKPLQIMHVPQASKSSTDVSNRQKRNRTRDLQRVGDALSKGEIDVHIVHHLKGKTKKEREQLINDALGKDLVLDLPERQTLAMKADLGMSWFKLNKLRRWFKKWGVKMESEKRQRKQKQEQIGDNLEAEFLPMEHSEKKANKVVTLIKKTPCAYVEDIQEKISSYVDKNAKEGLLTDHQGYIPADKLYIKLGGDHGQQSMKFAFQIANLEKPNSSKNTVVFSIFEAKDTRNNLRIALERYHEQLADLRQVKLHEQDVILFLFGDYEFLCKVMGISGASGRHPCLWCEVLSADMGKERSSRSNSQQRTLERMRQCLQEFLNRGGGDLKRAKDFYNVIHEPLLDIPIDHICIPGLHISLGMFLKFYELLLADCEDLDLKIATTLSHSDEIIGDSEFGQHVSQLQEARRMAEKAECLRSQSKEMQEYATHLLTAGDQIHTEESPNPAIAQLLNVASLLENDAEEKDATATRLRAKAFPRGIGMVNTGLNETLQSLRVQRQAYHSQTFVGNHVDICLKEENIHRICETVEKVVRKTCPKLQDEALEISHKYSKLLELFAVCHKKYNSSQPMSNEEIDVLDADIKRFMIFYRTKFPEATFPPKLHMLEDHVVPYIRKWHFPLGFFGEQGGESIHHEFVSLHKNFNAVHPAPERLKKMLEMHYVIVEPENRAIIPEKQKRNLKRKMENK